MKIRSILLCCCLLLGVSAQAAVTLPKKGSQPHPRLILKAGEEEAIRALIARDIYAYKIDSTIMAVCAERIKEPFYTEEKDLSGTRQKYGRQVGKNIHIFSYAARIHGREDYRDRAIEEMMRVCEWKDWNPQHFLDPSQMAFAVSLCYDWFYDYLTPKQRRIVRDALLDMAVYPSFEPKPDHYFYSPTNWSSVCNCGILSAALALYEEDSAAAQKVVDRCVEGNAKVFRAYDPMGAYPEGYGYWSYGTNHEVLILDMLENVLGSDYGLSTATPGFMLTPYFILHMNGPFGLGFNYGDNAPRMQFKPAVFWFAQKNYDPSLLYMEQAQILSGEDITVGSYYCLAAMMKWYSKISPEEGRKVPQDLIYENSDPKIPLFIYRSSWETPDAAYLGIRAGSTKQVNHSHVDVGSFVYYKDQVRWVSELGVADYTLAEKYLGHDPFFKIRQDAPRWLVQREGPFGHSIATFDGEIPVIDSKAPFVKTFRAKNQKGALMDLTSMYPGVVKSYHRMVYLDAADDLVITEKMVGGAQSHNVSWTLVTESEAVLQSDGSVRLSKNGKQRVFRISATGKDAAGNASAPELSVRVSDASSDKPYDMPNPGMNLIHVDFVLAPSATVNLITVLK